MWRFYRDYSIPNLGFTWDCLDRDMCSLFKRYLSMVSYVMTTSNTDGEAKVNDVHMKSESWQAAHPL